MDHNLNKVKEILKEYEQEHLLQFYRELTESQRAHLLNQILNIDFEQILSLYDEANKPSSTVAENIEPMKYAVKENLTPNSLKQYTNAGIKAIKSGKVGVITLAGGQGSRLGFKGPKGCFCLDTEPPKSLYEVLCDYIRSASLKYKVDIPWYIMTSTNNYFDTLDFFEKNNYFGYDRSNIHFFTQSNLPVIDINRKLVLSEIYDINLASNGNGNLFSSLKRANMIRSMAQKKLEWLFVGGIDNPLLNPLDPVFIGYTIHSKCKVGSKSLFKEDPADTSWVFALDKGKPSIVCCEVFAEELSQITDKKGNYLYRETNMLAHLFSFEAIKKMTNIDLSYHRAFRKNAFVNFEGMKQVPDSPNIYKFEQFIFDAFPYFDNLALLRVNADKEFSPIKSFNGPFNPEVATEKYNELVLGKFGSNLE